jgi:hypothetical protein
LVSAFKKVLKNTILDFRIKKKSDKLKLDNENMRNILFYQFKSSTCKFFFERFGKTEIFITDTPHYSLAKAWVSNKQEEIALAKKYYADYIKSSWGISEEKLINKRINEFYNQYLYNIKKSLPPPYVTSLPNSPKLYAVDGNHRISLALALGNEIDLLNVPFELAFSRYTSIDGFYGINSRNLPYQSLYKNKEIIAHGRRRDIVERLEMIPDFALKGKSVLDVASNIGMSSIVSRDFDVKKTLGLERSGQMIDIASRFSMFAGVYPKTSFIKFDIDKDNLSIDEKFDTAFIFSIYSHLTNPQRLIDLTKNNVKSFVVFEAHPGHSYDNYKEYFECGLFKSVDVLGRLKTSYFKQVDSRLLWICTLK